MAVSGSLMSRRWCDPASAGRACAAGVVELDDLDAGGRGARNALRSGCLVEINHLDASDDLALARGTGFVREVDDADRRRADGGRGRRRRGCRLVAEVHHLDVADLLFGDAVAIFLVEIDDLHWEGSSFGRAAVARVRSEER